VGALLLPLAHVRSPLHVGWLDDAWQVLLWSAAAVLVARARAPVVDREPGAQGRARLRGRVRLLLAAMPLLVTAAVLANDGRHVLVVAPLASAAAQGLALFGAVRLQLYGMARRTARTGALARDAAELERLALLGELGAVVAHEVRNPLTGIRSLAQRIGDGDVADPARRARFGQLIVTEVDRLERFVGSMLALAGDGGEAGPSHRNGDAPTAPLATLLEDVQALVAARAADRGVRVDVRTDAPGAVVPRGPLAQVLLNLVLNAIDHSPAGGTVALDARATAGGLEVVVRDAGPGIPPDRRAALFTPFAPGARGTGLGLAVVRRVADAQGWTVGVDDGPGPGATLRVRIPTAPSRGPLA
jgi:signal transduction histidine kinase